MGELIILSERLADRSRVARSSRPAFFFELGCPFSYLAAERVERLLGEVDWVPTSSAVLRRASNQLPLEVLRAQAERHAATLRLPLVWPDRFPGDAPGALRAAAHAAEVGSGAQFALAASRLAFCGGFDLDDPEILAEAAAAAGVALEDCLSAAGDVTRDESLHATARGLLERGIMHLPVIRVRSRWFQGENALAEESALLRTYAAYGRPLAPAG